MEGRLDIVALESMNQLFLVLDRLKYQSLLHEPSSVPLLTFFFFFALTKHRFPRSHSWFSEHLHQILKVVVS